MVHAEGGIIRRDRDRIGVGVPNGELGLDRGHGFSFVASRPEQWDWRELRGGEGVREHGLDRCA